MKVAIYTRVSTSQQTVQNQLLELYEVCERNDWTVVEEYSEVISGTKGVEERSELERMLIDASRKRKSFCFKKLSYPISQKINRRL
tara:strand:- start:726 stop:983 length:258 start_codon:yes stop_codon:yes gene_type:complete